MIDSNKKHCISIVVCIILIENTVEISPERKAWVKTIISSIQKYADRHWLQKVIILVDLDLCIPRNKTLGMGQFFRKGSSSLKLVTLKNTFFFFCQKSVQLLQSVSFTPWPQQLTRYQFNVYGCGQWCGSYLPN